MVPNKTTQEDKVGKQNKKASRNSCIDNLQTP